MHHAGYVSDLNQYPLRLPLFLRLPLKKSPRASRALFRLPILSTLCSRKRLPSLCGIRSTPR